MSWHFLPATRFAEQAPRWRQLHATGDASPLLADDFVAALLADLARGDEVLGWLERDGQTLAMTVLAPQGKGVWNTFQPPQAPVGIWLQHPGLKTGEELARLLRALPGPALLLGLTQCDPDLLARAPNSPAARSLDYHSTARITLSGGFGAYWNARGKNLRANLKKQRARLAREGIATRLQVSRERHEMAAAVADFGQLESAGWKGKGGTAVGGGAAQSRFYERMLEAFSARGAACVYRYWIGEQLAAMDLCVEGRDSFIVLKTTYDEQRAGTFSPALLMREEALRGLFDEGRFARLEFYGKVMEWHTRWTDEVRTLYHMTQYRWPLLARLHDWRQRTMTSRSKHVFE
ncbi:MAG: GNAT family N-acetyltransferase [Pseudomonadota bacterium]